MTTIRELDGRGLYYGFMAGAHRLIRNEDLLNALNIFPVPDADTGTNLAFTLRGALERTRPDRSLGVTAALLAEAALEGARGYSGVIFAQFIEGFRRGAEGLRATDTRGFAALVDAAAVAARAALSHPVEGTIITVMRRWAEAVEVLSRETDDFVALIARSQVEAHRSLAETTASIPVLARAGVVDAGAKGFVLFLEGLAELLQHGGARALLSHRHRPSRHVVGPAATHTEFVGRYCTELTVEGENLDNATLAELAGRFGDSVVVAGSRRKLRVHLHTDRPDGFVAALDHRWTLPFQKVEDLQRQVDMAHAAPGTIALVSDSGADLPPDLLERHRINVVPFNIILGHSNYVDKYTMPVRRLYELIATQPAVPTTSQPSAKAFSETYAFLLQHCASIISLHISARLSGTFSNARQAAAARPEGVGRLEVLDSRTLSGAQGLLVLRAARAIEAGLSHAEVVRGLNEWIEKSQLLVGVRSLRSMVRSGRVTQLKGAVARALNLKPVVAINREGAVVFAAKAFSRRGLLDQVRRLMARMVERHGLWGWCALHAHDEREAGRLAALLARDLGRDPEFTIEISPAIGLHAGRGCVGVAFLLP